MGSTGTHTEMPECQALPTFPINDAIWGLGVQIPSFPCWIPPCLYTHLFMLFKAISHVNFVFTVNANLSRKQELSLSFYKLRRQAHRGQLGLDTFHSEWGGRAGSFPHLPSGPMPSCSHDSTVQPHLGGENVYPTGAKLSPLPKCGLDSESRLDPLLSDTDLKPEGFIWISTYWCALQFRAQSPRCPQMPSY